MILLLLFAALAVAQLCDRPPLPTHLNLEPRGELSLQGAYLADYARSEHSIYFNVTAESHMRAYIAPHASVDVDLWLFEEPTTTFSKHSELGLYTPEMLTATLQPGSYRIRIDFVGFSGNYENPEEATCPTLRLEVAIVPKSLMATRIQADTSCVGGGDRYPAPDFTKLVAGDMLLWDPALNGTASDVFRIHETVYSPAPAKSAVILKHRYKIDVVPALGANYWFIEVILGAEFISGGQYGLLLTKFDASRSPGDALAGDLDCLGNSTCAIGAARFHNEKYLKQLVTPGSYEVWIYERPDERMPSLTQTCTPITMSFIIEPSHEKENFISCRASTLPTHFGLFDGTAATQTIDGVLFADRVLLDVSQQKQTVQVQVEANSVIRAYVDGGRVDMDLRIRSVAHDHTEASGLSVGFDGVYAEIEEAGLYNITISSFGAYEPASCSTFDAVIAVDTAASATAVKYCPAGAADKLPDLSQMDSVLQSGESFLINATDIFRVEYNGRQSKQKIAGGSFNVTGHSVLFYAKLEHYFLMGPLTLKLTSKTRTTYGKYQRDGVLIDDILEPGHYDFEILTGKVNYHSGNYSFIPGCALFGLDLRAHPRDFADLDDATDCWRMATLPASLQTPGYLATSNRAHLAGYYKIEFEGESISYSETVDIGKVRQNSILRMVTSEDSRVDADLYLYKRSSAQVLAHSVSFDGREESILYLLEPNEEYYVEVIYYLWAQLNGAAQSVCYQYHVELAVEPVVLATAPTPRPTPAIAPSGACGGSNRLLPRYTLHAYDTYELDRNFRFSQQRAQSFSNEMLIVLSQPSVFRATLKFNFPRHHLQLQLFGAGNDTYLDDSASALWRDNLITTGVGTFDGDEIEALELDAGAYVVRVLELKAQTDVRLLSCAYFRLHLGTRVSPAGAVGDNLTVDLDDVELLRCPTAQLGTSFDRVAHLSPRTGNAMHIEREVLGDVVHKKGIVTFTLEAQSIFRLRVPNHQRLDIDVKLYNGTRANVGHQLASRTGFSDEAVLMKLETGDYVLEFRYRRRGGVHIKPHECVTFPFEVEIEPVSRLLALPAFQQTCSAPTLPTFDLGAQPVDFELNHPLTAPLDLSFGSFNVTQNTYISIEAEYDFITGALEIELSGLLPRGTSGRKLRKHLPPVYGQGRALMQQVLLPGVYTLKVGDIVKGDELTDAFTGVAKCSPFKLHIESRFNNLPPYECYGYDSLPSSASSFTSWAYGGPQDRITGEVQLYGDNFYLDPREENADQYMKFYVHQDSYVRFYVGAGEEDDVDFYIYKNATQNDLLASSNNVGADESALFFLEKQDEPYLLNVYFFTVESNPPCRRFIFEMAERPATDVHNELLCPAPLPNQATRQPPQDIFLDATKQLGPGPYFFTSDFIDRNTTGQVYEQQFSYRMSVSAPTGAEMSARIGFDFLANDFRLELRTSDDVVVASGKPARAEQRSSNYINFENALNYQLNAGTQYYLYILEDMTEKELKLGNRTYCHKFEFSVDAVVANPTMMARVPHVFFVSPSSGSDLNPLAPLDLTVYLSAPVKYDAATDGPLLQYLNGNNVVSLVESPGGAVKQPSTATMLSSTGRSFQVSFNYTLLEKDHSYDLKLEMPRLHADTSGSPAFATYGESHTYAMQDCSCNGHGTCRQEGMRYRCACQSPFVGLECRGCADGWHSAVNGCVRDVKCTADFCGEHGVCNDAKGYPECTCNTGYATRGTDFCRSCARGFYGFPKCHKSLFARSSRCTAPLLPTSLDGIAYLGYDQQVHLQDYYYIDTNFNTHITRFTLRRESVLRLFVERHRIDIDVLLFPVMEDGSLGRAIEEAAGVGTEETIFSILDGSESAPQEYQLIFRYFDIGNGDGGLFGDLEAPAAVDCETFNLELAILPTSKLAGEKLLNNVNCGAADKLPLDGQEELEISRDYSYAPVDKLFTINSKPESAIDLDAPNYVYELKLIVKDPPKPGQIAMLHVDLGYRFVLGDLALLLEHGEHIEHGLKGSCESRGAKNGLAGERFDWDDDMSHCVNGINYGNRHVLEQKLTKGNYTLHIYEPRPQLALLSKCSVFDFQMSVKYVQDDSTVFNCDGAEIPPDLNTPSYLAQGSGHMHFFDYFLVPGYRVMHFQLETTSLLRVRWLPSRMSVRLRQKYTTVTKKTASFAQQGHLFSELPAGNYSLVVTRLFGSAVSFCNVSPLEVAIKPTAALSCTSQSLPIFNINSVPFNFTGLEADGTPARFVADTRSTDIASYEFDATSITEIRAGVSSDFLRADLSVVLYREVSPGTMREEQAGFSSYNHNELRLIISPGKYQLRIQQPTRKQLDAPPYAFCIPFNFFLNLKNVVVGDVNDCFITNGVAEELPTTLNGERYLAGGERARLHFQNTQFLVPNSERFLDEHKVEFVAPKTTKGSLLRVYIERHEIDIDVELLDTSVGTNGKTVARGDNRLKGEETFVHRLEPGRKYIIVLTFWHLGTINSQCPTFGMAIDIEPFEPLYPRTCLNGADHLPPMPETLEISPKPYEYDSRRASGSLSHPEKLFLQQNTEGPRSFSWKFTTSQIADLFFEVSYDFLLGDLAMRLESSSQHAATVYGSNRRDRNVLLAQGVAPGTYTLVVYEPEETTDQLRGCNVFAFRVITQAAHIPPEKSIPRLPATLNGVAYLGGADSLHMTGPHVLFETWRTKTAQTTFEIKTQSIVRIAATQSTKIALYTGSTVSADKLLVADNGGSLSYNDNTMIAKLLERGTYTVEFSARSGIFFVQAPSSVDLEFVIEPSNTIISANEAAAKAQCYAEFIDAPLVGEHGYHGSYKSLTAPTSTLTSDEPLQSVDFTLVEDSVVYMRLAFNFAAYALALQLNSTNAHRLYQGSRGNNIVEVNQVVPAGTYSLSVFQPVAVPSEWTSTANLAPQCARYELAISIQSTDTAAISADCSEYETLPTSLNDFGGISRSFGSPLSADGHLNLFSDKFFMSGVTYESSDTMMVVISKPSVISMFTSNNVDTSINPTLVPLESETAQAANFVDTDFSESHHIWYVEPGTYSLTLNYVKHRQRACHFLTLQLLISPFAELSNQLTCTAESATKAQLPTKSNGAVSSTFYESKQSYVTPAVLSQNVNEHGDLRYNVNFTISSRATVQASVSYNALVSGFHLELWHKERYGPQWQSDGRREPVSGSAATTLSSNLVYQMQEPGDYTLRIIQPRQNHTWTLGMPFDYDDDHSLCLPFVYELCIGPADAAFVVVDPPGAEQLALDTALVVTFQFSAPVYDYAGKQLVAASAHNDQRTIVTETFKMVAEDGSNLLVQDVSVRGNEWKLTFHVDNESRGKDFVLKQSSGKLFDKGQHPVIMCGAPIYSVVKGECEHGTYLAGVCLCDTGYAGPTCAICDTDYQEKDGKCQLIPGGACRATSCSCQPGTAGVDCIPLGKCSIENGETKCDCWGAGVDGAKSCAGCKTGFGGWPSCIKCRPGEPCNDMMRPQTTVPGQTVTHAIEGSTTMGEKSNSGNPTGPPIGLIAGVGGGIVVLLAVIGIIIWRKKRSGYARVGGGGDADDMLDLDGHSMSVKLEDDSASLL